MFLMYDAKRRDRETGATCSEKKSWSSDMTGWGEGFRCGGRAGETDWPGLLRVLSSRGLVDNVPVTMIN